MTNTPRERWTDERLDRFGDFVERSIASLTEASVETKANQTNTMQLFSELRANQAMLQEEQAELARERNQLLGIIAQQQSDIISSSRI